MKSKFAHFSGETAPIAPSLPQSAAASIGRTILRHAFLESILSKIVYSLLGISSKQGRVAVRLPPASRYVSTVQDLLLFHKIIAPTYNFRALAKALNDADSARNTLAHSIFLRRPESGELLIQIVRGSWELDQDVISVSRALQPQGKPVNRAFLKAQRAAVENGIRAARDFHTFVKHWLGVANEKRRTLPEQDRRRRSSDG